jgi:putative membrane protein
MPSEQRLHPLSILFGFGKQLRSLALPVIVVLVTAGTVGLVWQLWALPFLIPYVFVSVARYISFRYRYEENEMVIRTGLFFRNERHVPYARIQNLDAVQNVFHRLWNVVEVRVETGGGQEPEATMSVLPVAAYEEMRRRVFKEREAAARPADTVSGADASETPDAAETPAVAPASGRTVLHLPPRELILAGLLQNRGSVVIAAAFGLLWEVNMAERFGDWGGWFPKGWFPGDWIPGDWEAIDKKASRGVVRSVFSALFGDGELPVDRIVFAVGAIAALLVVSRLISMVWTLIRLHDFKLSRAGRAGEDLRTEFGLFTRVTTTIPLRRIQTLTIHEGPLHRLFKRASVRAETAGGQGGGEGEEGNKKQREWLAPVLRREELPGFLHEILPELDFAAVEWRPAPPRAYRRELKSWVIIAVLASIPIAIFFKWWHPPLLAVLLAGAFVGARQYVKHLGWAVTDGAVLFRTGWLWRNVTAARFNKIQAVAIHESPFDRRAAMARVRVDTAGAGDSSHRVDIPYLPRDTARDLHDLLVRQAALTAFRW